MKDILDPCDEIRIISEVYSQYTPKHRISIPLSSANVLVLLHNFPLKQLARLTQDNNKYGPKLKQHQPPTIPPQPP